MSVLSRLTKKASSYGFDGFLLGIAIAILLAYIFPSVGAKESPIPLAEIANFCVSLIFFFYGLKLSPQKLKEGLANWKLHVLVHASTFILFPLLVILLHKIIPSFQSDVFWTGLFYLAALPSTVSSSVVMVSIARGNMPAAIFNASISSLLGVFITPIWMEFWMSEKATDDFDLSSVIIKLLIQVVVPVLLGLLLHRKYVWFAEKYNKRLKQFDQSIILLIIFTAFCESFSENVFALIGVKDLLQLLISTVALFFLVLELTNLLSRLLGFNREDRITLIFCGSKKSLVHGTVMSKILFPTSDQMGLILLPLMVYHTAQLIIASIIANKFAGDSTKNIAP